MKNNIGLFLTKRAALSPNVEAYVDVDRNVRLTFAELNEWSNRLANLLKDQGVKKGHRVGLLMMNSPEFVAAFFAVAKIGAINVPLNWRLVADELEFILKDSGTGTLLYGGQFADTVADLHSRGPKTEVKTWIHHGPESTSATFAKDFNKLFEDASTAEPECTACDDDDLYIMYTSGTTGLPKGVVHTHNTAMWGVLTIAATADFRYKDRYLLVLPMFHVGALTPATVAVYRGVTSVAMEHFDPAKAWRIIEEEKITTALLVPAMANFMLQVPEADQHDHSQLRWILCGAAPVPVTLIENYEKRGIEIHQIYGLTESCGPACLVLGDDALAKAGSTGKAFYHTEVRVVDEKGEDVAPGEPGEVIIRGPNVMKEYWNRPEATAETIRDGWLYSGDVAHMDKDGFIYIQDRTKDMIISGGENIYPAEIENVIMQHPGVREVAVIGQPSEKWGESPFAIVVPKEPDGVDPHEIMNFCNGKLSRYKLPKDVTFIGEIPRNPSGKVLKRVLREQFPGPAKE